MIIRYSIMQGVVRLIEKNAQNVQFAQQPTYSGELGFQMVHFKKLKKSMELHGWRQDEIALIVSLMCSHCSGMTYTGRNELESRNNGSDVWGERYVIYGNNLGVNLIHAVIFPDKFAAQDMASLVESLQYISTLLLRVPVNLMVSVVLCCFALIKGVVLLQELPRTPKAWAPLSSSQCCDLNWQSQFMCNVDTDYKYLHQIINFGLSIDDRDLGMHFHL